MSVPDGEYSKPTMALVMGFVVLCVGLLIWFLNGDLIVAIIFAGGMVLSMFLVFLGNHSPERVKAETPLVERICPTISQSRSATDNGPRVLFFDAHNFSLLMPWKHYIYPAGLIGGA